MSPSSPQNPENATRPLIFNPSQMSPGFIERLFVVRQRTYQELLQTITGTNARNHQLISALRGMGKTTLMYRLVIALEQDAPSSEGKKTQFLPMQFHEEQYNIDRPSEFWLNTLKGLRNHLKKELDHGTDPARDRESLEAWIKRIRTLIDDFPYDEEPAVEQALSLLGEWADESRKRVVLFVDNFNMIVDAVGSAAREFRRQFDRAEWCLLMAATPGDTSFTDEPAFKKFFTGIHTLDGITLEETKTLLAKLSELRGEPELLSEAPGRLRTFYNLTGGNIRTTVILHDVLSSERDGSLFHQLNHLLDEHSVLYKARIEELPVQARKVAEAMLEYRDPITVADLARKVRLDVRIVSGQLDRLRKLGFVQEAETVGKEPKKLFLIAERFFNIWYLMRKSQSVESHQKMLWLVECIALLWGDQRLAEKERDLKDRLSRGEISEEHKEYARAQIEAGEYYLQQRQTKDKQPEPEGERISVHLYSDWEIQTWLKQSESENIEELILYGNVTDVGITEIANANWHQLQSLNLAFTKVTDVGITEIANAVELGKLPKLRDHGAFDFARAYANTADQELQNHRPAEARAAYEQALKWNGGKNSWVAFQVLMGQLALRLLRGETLASQDLLEVLPLLFADIDNFARWARRGLKPFVLGGFDGVIADYLDEEGLAERVAPIYAALRVAEKGRKAFNRIPPEVRNPAEELLEEWGL